MTMHMEPIPERPVPPQPWGRAAILALVLLAVGLGGWEAFWRGQQFRPSYRNSDGLWAINRRKIDRTPHGTTILGSSRALFDLNLETWNRETGSFPVQIALEGSNPRPILDDLAGQTTFDGLVVVGVTPPLFFSPGFGYREKAFQRYRNESPSQWCGQRLSMLAEPYLAFYSFDTALFTVLKRQTWWPARPGLEPPPRPVRKLCNMRVTRQADLWSKLDDDPAYAALCQQIWLDFLKPPKEMPSPEEAQRQLDAALDEVRENVEAIRARGGEVVFLRLPSTHAFREAERHGFPRERFWDELIRRTVAVGVHFEDHPELQDVRVPEWSHVSSHDTDRLTTNLIDILRRELAARGISRPELGG